MMSFQAYLDTIYANTGKTPEDFRTLAEAKGLLKPGVKPMEIVNWLKRDYDLGRGHAMALIVTFNQATQPQLSLDQQIAERFAGAKSDWRPVFDTLVKAVQSFGPGVTVKPTASYLSLLKNGTKFAVIQPTVTRLDVGIKDKNALTTERYKIAGNWNVMVTHRIRIEKPDQLDDELMKRLRAAYDLA
jgi:hypothetical protein